VKELISQFISMMFGSSLADSLIDIISNMILGSIIIVLTCLCSYFVKKFIGKLIERFKDTLPTTIFINMGRVVVWSIGISILLSACFDINPSGIVTALGVGGIALSLGLQDTISNIISGLQLSTVGVMKIGDHVMVNNLEGIVEDMTWRQTVIRGFAGEQYIVPNSVINTSALSILPPVRKIKVAISLPYEALNRYFEKGIETDQVARLIGRRVTQVLTLPAPNGMALELQDEVQVILKATLEYAIKGFVIVWLEEGVVFKKDAVENTIVTAVSDVCSESLESF